MKFIRIGGAVLHTHVPETSLCPCGWLVALHAWVVQQALVCHRLGEYRLTISLLLAVVVSRLASRPTALHVGADLCAEKLKACMAVAASLGIVFQLVSRSLHWVAS